LASFGSLPRSPLTPRFGRFAGALGVRRLRTTAGCTIMPGEEESYPEMLVLALDDGLVVPLKALDPARAGALVQEVARAETRRGRVPPIASDPLLALADAPRFGPLGSRVELEAITYPVYVTGGIAAVTIWGLYARR
jgi:hypothetical protein